MKVFSGIEEFEAAAGTQLGTSDWHPVTQQQVDLFAEATGDSQWIHVDAGRAAHGPFGGTVAHGFLTLSLVPVLMAEVYRVDGLAMAVNYGCDTVRFPAPVPVGSRLRGSVSLTATTRTPAGVRAALEVAVECDRASKPACVVHALVLMVPSPAPS